MSKQYLGIDVGTVRIGIAAADDQVRIAIPQEYVAVDGNEVKAIMQRVISSNVDTIVIGYPRNQSGEPTEQTKLVEAFAEKLQDLDATIVFQDESLTSVMAESRLKQRKAGYSKGDIDSEAAAIILQDYMEQQL